MSCPAAEATPGPDAGVVHRYFAYGLRIGSGLELPELPPAPPELPGTDVGIRLGPVPATLPDAVMLDVRAWLLPNQALLRVPEVADFLLRDGTSITVQPAAGVDAGTLRFHLLGLVLGVLFAQRGTVALHAGAIEWEGGCIAFLGPSGAGKSTLAARLHARGHPLVCDDACVIDRQAERISAWYGGRRLKLWDDALEGLDQRASSLGSVRVGLPEKHYLPARPTGRLQALPFHALYLVEPQHGDATQAITRLQGVAALRALRNQMHGRDFHRHLHGEQRWFEHCTALLERVPLFCLPIRRGFGHLDAEIDRLERHLAQRPFQPA